MCNDSMAQSNSATDWAKRIGGTGSEQPASKGIAKDDAGNIYSLGAYSAAATFLGSTTSLPLNNTGGNDVFILKSDAAGNVIWAKQIASTIPVAGAAPVMGWALDADAAGNVYATGSYTRNTVDFDPGIGIVHPTQGNDGGSNMFILKLNTLGNYVWHKEIKDTTTGTTATAAGRAIKVDAAGNIYAASSFKGRVFFGLPSTTVGLLQSTGTSNNTAILKWNASGDLLWAKQFSTSGSNNNNVAEIDVDPLGHVYTVGDFTGTGTNQIDFDPAHAIPSGSSAFVSSGSNDIFIAKLDAAGNYVWAKVIGTANAEYCHGVAVDGNSLYITGGFSGTGNLNFDPGGTCAPLMNATGNTDIYVAKYSLSGSFQWVKKFGGVGADRGRGITVSENGDVYVVGDHTATTDFDPLTSGNQTIASFGSVTDAFTLQLNNLGHFGWVVGMGTPGGANAYDLATDVVVHAAPGSRSIYTLGYIGSVANLTPAVFPTNFNGTTTPSTTLTGAGGLDIFLHKALETSCIATSSSLSITACGSFTLGSNTYTTSGTYTPTFVNAGGCDSTVTLTLSINEIYTTNFSQEACDSFHFGGQTYFSSGNYTHTFQSVNGCDSIATVFLAIGTSSTSSVSETSCDAFVFEGFTYTQSGNYQITIPNAVGCDSVITLQLTINTLEATATINDNTLTAQPSGATYQWLHCNANNTPIANATQQSYTPNNNGSYAVIVTQNGCTDTSDCLIIDGIVSVDEINKDKIYVSIYPNPATEKVSINSAIHGYLVLTDIEGRVIKTNTIQAGIQVVDIADVASGMYFLKFYDTKGISVQILKLSKTK